jgi:hypothetical protein
VPHQHPEPPVEEILEEHDRFGRRLAVAIVLATLAAAVVAYLQANSVLRHAEAASRAEQWATLAASARSRAENAAQIQLARARLAHEDRVRAQHALAKRLMGVGGNARALRREERGWRSLAANVEERSSRIAERMEHQFELAREVEREALPNVDPDEHVTADCEHAPEDAGGAPPPLRKRLNPNVDFAPVGRYLASSRREEYRFDALRGAATHEAETAEKQFTRYAVSLAMFAVAVFLFGYAMTPFGHRYRRLYAVAAGCVAVGSALWGVYSFARGPEHPSPRAAAAYADGRVAHEAGAHHSAIRLLTCALEIREDFPAAYLARSEAYTALGTPQRAELIFNETLVNPHYRERAAEDAEHASEGHDVDPRTIAQLAVAEFAQALAHDDQVGLEHALELHEDARELQPKEPLHTFNVGTTLLALGRPWRAEYEEAFHALQQHELAFYVPAALTDLHAVAARLPSRIEQVREARQEVVGAALRSNRLPDQELPASAPDALRDVGLTVTPGAVDVTFSTSRALRVRDSVYAAVYYDTGRGWAASSSLSGVLDSLESRGTRQYGQIVAPAPGSACTDGGRYRVEVYVNGTLVRGATAQTRVRFPELVHERLDDLNVELCRPAGWQPVRGRVEGVADGFTSPGGRRGVLVVDASVAVTAGVRSGDLVEFVQARFPELLPRRARPVGDLQVSYVLGLAGQTWQSYRYPDGSAVFGTATTTADRPLVVAVFGPHSSFIGPSTGSTLKGADLFFSLMSRDP